MPSLNRWMMTTAAMTIAVPPPTASPAARATPSRKLWIPMPTAPATPDVLVARVLVVELGRCLVADVQGVSFSIA